MEKPYLKLVRDLEAKIAVGQLRSGEKLPSLRALSTETGLTLDMVRRAMRTLGDKGLIEARHGDGFYVARAKMTGGRTRIAVIFFFRSPEQGAQIGYFSAVALRGVQIEAAAYDVTLILHSASNAKIPAGESDRVAEILDNAHCDADAVIMLGAFDIDRINLNCRVPVVGVVMGNNYDGLLSLVSLDPVSAGKLAADYFHQAGVRRVRIYGHHWGDCALRAQAFAGCWDGDLEWIPSNRPDDAALSRNLSCLDFPEGVGYWFSNGTLAEYHAVRFRSLFGAGFAASRKALSLDGKSLISRDYEPIDTITPDWEYIGKLALREALRRLREPGSGALRIAASVRLEHAPLR